MSSCSTHSGASNFGCSCASSGTPTSPLHFVSVPAELGRAWALFLLSICWDCPLNSACQCCPRAWQSALVHPRSSPGLPRRKQPVLNTVAHCLLPQPGREMCLPCITAAVPPHPLLSWGRCMASPPHSGLLQAVPPARPPSRLPGAQRSGTILGCCHPALS